jgi:hypothetical protein
MWEDGRSVDPDPTWGFYVMVTDYSQTARDDLNRAMEKHQELGANAARFVVLRVVLLAYARGHGDCLDSSVGLGRPLRSRCKAFTCRVSDY